MECFRGAKLATQFTSLVSQELTSAGLSDVSQVHTVRSRHNDTTSLQSRINVLVQGIKDQRLNSDGDPSLPEGLQAQLTSDDYDSPDTSGGNVSVDGSVSGSVGSLHLFTVLELTSLQCMMSL